ncbi:MAG: NADAR family protein [Candidatus Saccharimonadales bacterium]
MAVERFREDNFFLSNMYPFERGIRTPDGEEVHTSEQLYLPAEFLRKSARLVLQQASDGFKAKGLMRPLRRAGFETRKDWDAARIPAMKKCLLVKFVANPDLAEKLLETGEEELVEGNDRGDTFWGVSPMPPEGKGENMLGKLLMETRASLASPGFAESVDVESAVRDIYVPTDMYEGL